MKRVKAVVSGRVQGVWFRASTREKAEELGVRGYVKNLPDGRVEIVAVGEKEKVDALLEWASQGPPGARVKDITLKTLETAEQFDRFFVAF